MKKIILFLALVLCVSAGRAQVSPYTNFGQLVNLSNANANTFNDTSGPATLYLTTGITSKNVLPVKQPLYGTGTISFVVSALKAQITTTTVNAIVTTTPQASFDGVTWATIPGVTVSTLTATSATVPVTTMWQFAANYAPYYRLKNAITVDTASVSAYWFLNKSTSNLK